MTIIFDKDDYERVEMWKSLTSKQRDFFINQYISFQQELSYKNKRLSRLERLSTYDTLTNVLNERNFDKEGLRAMKEYQRGIISDLSLFYIDINDFKSINDVFGHAYGDLLLKGFSDRLLTVLREDIDILGRFHGDEFGVLLKGTSLEDAYKVAERIYQNFEEYPLMLDSRSFKINASIGISSADMTHHYFKLKNFADYALIHQSKVKKALSEPTISIYTKKNSLEDYLEN